MFKIFKTDWIGRVMRATYDNPGRVVKIGLAVFIAQMVFSFLSPFIPVVRDLSFLPMPMEVSSISV